MLGSTPRRNRTETVHQAARRLVDGLRGVDLEELAHDPARVSEHLGVAVRYAVEVGDSSRCSIAGTYTPDPPTITVTLAASQGRERFSLLHELAHHLQRNDFDAIDLLNRAGKERRTLEEDVCDAFAAEILLPDEAVDEALDGQLPSAAALVNLYKARPASRAACCVRIAQRLGTSGYVLLADADTRIAFAARAGDAFPLARGTLQDPDGLIAEAAQRRKARGKARVTYPSGWQSPAYFGDLMEHEGWVFGVLQAQAPGWQVVPLTEADLKPLPPAAECGHCGQEFQGWKRPCERCDVRECPSCGRCGCTTAIAPRTCQGCWLLLPPHRFPDNSPFCEDCA